MSHYSSSTVSGVTGGVIGVKYEVTGVAGGIKKIVH